MREAQIPTHSCLGRQERSISEDNQELIKTLLGTLPKSSRESRRYATGEKKIPAGEAKIPAGETEIPAGEAEIPAGEAEIPAGEPKILRSFLAAIVALLAGIGSEPSPS